ncbi:MAG: hypothetical protein ABJ084_05740 [Halioglobus sp.]
MKFGLLKSVLSVFTVMQAGAVFAAMSDTDAQQTVQKALADGFSADAIVEMLVNDGRTLPQVGEVVVNASTGDTQIDLARAAICASTDEEEAEVVGASAIAQVGQGDVAAQIEGIVEVYETTGCAVYAVRRQAPPSYSPNNTGTGGGTNLIIVGGSPGSTGNGTIPPGGGGTIPPGSPAN